MSNKIPIQITIPEPCNQSWEQMTPGAAGKFCGHCKKAVIDFTGWNDADLYRFFRQQQGSVCGRFHIHQLNRPIQLPVQPHTRLYQLAVALGLTLLLIPASQIHARPKPPMTAQNAWMQNDTTVQNTSKDSFIVSGVVLDAQKQPAIGAIIKMDKDGIAIAGAATDADGMFSITLKEKFVADRYSLTFTYTGHQKVRFILTNPFNNLNVLLSSDNTMILGGPMVIIRHWPLVSPEHPGSNLHFDREQINREAH